MSSPDERELRETLADVSRLCLRGDAVPADLAALWRASLSDDTELLDAFEMLLLEEPGDGLFEHIIDDQVEPALARAFSRMTAQVCWVAEIDGLLVGYWVGEERRPVAQSPLVICDDDGQFELGAMTMAELLLDFFELEDLDEFVELRHELEAIGIHVPVQQPSDIWDRLEGWDDPNQVVLGYVVEERMDG